MIVKECSQKYYDKLLSKNKVDGDTLYVIKSKYKELEEENKRLQEQLKEANEILMMPDNIKYHDGVVEMLNNYMEKWGVK